MKNIVVVDGVLLNEGQLARLHDLGSVTVYERLPEDRIELANRLSDAHIAIVSEVCLDSELLKASNKLEMLSLWSSGYDHVDVRAAVERNITVCHAPGCTATAIAEHTLGIALYFLLQLGEADRHVRKGEYAWDRFITPEFRGRTFGIIGLGNIGTRVAEYARLLCAEVLVHTRTPSQEQAENLGVTFVDLRSLLQRSDIISINTELTPETVGMIGPEEFALMERQPILINTARGKVVVQAALVDALRGGRIRAAGLDVLHDEPPDLSDPLLKMENVLFTPHCSSATVQGFEAQSELCVRNVEAFLEGRPENVVTP